jgi:molybdopterin-guanine dinucleotide biosynthesis protein A
MGGGDKGLRPLQGRAILHHLIDRLSPQVAPLALNANGDRRRFSPFGLPVVGDDVADRPGPLAGILAAMDWAATLPGEQRFVVTCPTDSPFVPLDMVGSLSRAIAGHDIAVAASGGRLHRVTALWSVALAHRLRRAVVDEGLRRVEDFMSRFPVASVEFPILPFDPFFNINDAADLAQAEGIATALSSASARPRSTPA